METNQKKSIWDTKPYWCQPWTIIVFGVSIIIISWEIFNNFIITSTLGFIITIWWILFLIIAPNAYQEINEKKQL